MSQRNDSALGEGGERVKRQGGTLINTFLLKGKLVGCFSFIFSNKSVIVETLEIIL